MTCGVPNLSLDDFFVDADASGGELDADRGFGLEAELVAGEAREEVGFADAGVSDQDHLVEEIVIVVSSVRRHCEEVSSIGDFSGTKGEETHMKRE